MFGESTVREIDFQAFAAEIGKRECLTLNWEFGQIDYLLQLSKIPQALWTLSTSKYAFLNDDQHIIFQVIRSTVRCLKAFVAKKELV